MLHGMLSRECEGKYNSGGMENLTIFVKAGKSILYLLKSVVCDNILAHKIAKLQERSKRPHNIEWNMTFNC